jgi:hypothetical protein
MGQLLHLDLKGKNFDTEKARRRIAAANRFCDDLTTELLIVKSHLHVVEQTCCDGHITKRNAARLREGQIIPCVNQQCRSVFIVEQVDPLVWKEFRLQIKCDACGLLNCYPPKALIGLSYWEKASVPCLNEICDNDIQVQWVLSRSIRKNPE